MSSLCRSNSSHVVAGRGQRGGLLVDHVVLAAGSSGAVAAVDEQDLHRVGSLRLGDEQADRDAEVEEVRRRVAQPGLGDRGDQAVDDDEQRDRPLRAALVGGRHDQQQQQERGLDDDPEPALVEVTWPPSCCRSAAR